MLRKGASASSMQKTYDECYLICSTAIYFEGQNNEKEALRSWRNALDQIYYHNAYRMPSNFQPRTETERALHESLRSMELQCKERVDLFEALRKSRQEAEDAAKGEPSRSRESLASVNKPTTNGEGATWLGADTVPPVSYSDLPRAPQQMPERRPAPPPRPPYAGSPRSYVGRERSSSEIERTKSLQPSASPALAPPPSTKERARTPSPEKKAGGMLKTLRPTAKERPGSGKMASTMRPRPPPAAAKAASQVWAPSPPPPPAPRPQSNNATLQPPSPSDYIPYRSNSDFERLSLGGESTETVKPPSPPPPVPPPHKSEPPSISYMKEFPNHPPLDPARPKPPPKVPARKAVGVVNATAQRQQLDNISPSATPPQITPRKAAKRKVIETKPIAERAVTPPTTDESHDSDDNNNENNSANSKGKDAWDEKVKAVMKNLPRGVDEAAAKQIFNEIVIQGDEVHWDDVAGLDIAKSALKETVVYPFLRPDLFMGLREPARGMLLFGPPGTGKTMLARAVATESKSVFFAISASSLTSKYLGESEKLVRALFAIAKVLAPSIIFVDEIDSLLGSRGGSSEHEATRRIKTEFLIQWSDLQKAAAGAAREGEDPSRVLVLAATNTPWAIDEAARRRFVRRQYIPLPEDWVREQQLRTLLAAQKHSLSPRDIQQLVLLTENFSGSDITALAKDAAMGPLRSLGEQLLHMSPDEIRGIKMEDFRASLVNIRPSVSKAGLKEFEDWAREFGERGG